MVGRKKWLYLVLLGSLLLALAACSDSYHRGRLYDYGDPYDRDPYYDYGYGYPYAPDPYPYDYYDREEWERRQDLLRQQQELDAERARLERERRELRRERQEAEREAEQQKNREKVEPRRVPRPALREKPPAERHDHDASENRGGQQKTKSDD